MTAEVFWRKDGTSFPVQYASTPIHEPDITERKQAERERERLIDELRSALARVKTLAGMIPICAGGKKIRDDKGYWSQVESCIQKHTEARFSHGVCPDRMKKWYPDLEEESPEAPTGGSPPDRGHT